MNKGGILDFFPESDPLRVFERLYLKDRPVKIFQCGDEMPGFFMLFDEGWKQTGYLLCKKCSRKRVYKTDLVNCIEIKSKEDVIQILEFAGFTSNLMEIEN